MKNFHFVDDIDSLLPPISLIIPFRADSYHRNQMFNWQLKRYKMLFPEFEICLGDNVGEPFSRSKARNIAAKAASNDLLLFVDIDLLCARKVIHKAIEALDNYIIMKEHNIKNKQESYAINYNSTTTLLKSELPIDCNLELESHRAGTFYFCLIKKDAFLNIGGWDERFKGWGLEDGAFFKTLNIYYGRDFDFQGPLFHLWHPSSVDKTIDLWRNEWENIKKKPPYYQKWHRDFNPVSVHYYQLYENAKTIEDIKRIRGGFNE